MLESRRIAALAATTFLALPGTALAQGAGETQYTDPLEEERTSSKAKAGAQDRETGAETGGPALSTTPPAGGARESEAARTRTPRGELARTGAEPGLIALLGAGFILTGAGLRVRVRRPLA